MSMPKGKHQGGQTQGYSQHYSRTASFVSRSATPQQRPDVTFHVAATAFPPQQGGGAAPPGGPQLRSLHHPHHGASPSLPPSHQQQPPPPNQPQHSSGQPGPVPTSTPPGPAEMGKQGPHIQGQPQGIPQGGQMQLSFSVPNQSRPNQSQPYFAGPRGPAPRMPNHRGPVVNMPANNVGQQIYSPTVPLPPMQMYPVAPLNAGGQMFVPGQVQVFSTGSRHQGAGTNFFQPPAGSQQLLMHQHQLPFQGFQPNQGPYFYSSMRGAGMTGAPGGVGPGMTGGANQQVVVPGTAPQMGQTGQVSMMALPGSNVMGVSGLAGDSGTPSGPVSSSNSTGNKQIRRKHALDIVDPITMKNVDIYDSSGGSTPQRSGDSSARETPQPNPGPGQMDVAAEFAARVAKAASEKSSGPPPSQDVFTEPSSASVHQVTNVNGPEPISMSSISTSDSVLSQTDNLSKPSGAGLEDCISSSSWKQTQPKVVSIGNKINSNTKHVKIEVCASKIEDQGTLNLEANNVLKQEIDRERVPPGVPSVSIKDVPVSQPELPVTTSLVQPVIPTVVAPLKEHSLSVLPDPSLTPVVSAITNSPDIELVHHRSSNREQYPGLKSSSPAHLSPRRKPRVPENPSFGKVISSQSLPAVSTVGNLSSAITQVSSTVGTTASTSGDIKTQREPSSIPVSTGEQRLVQSKKVPVSESTSNQCVDASGFVAPVSKEHHEEKKPRSRDRSSQGKDVADKVHEKSQCRDRDKMTARNKENTTPQSSSSSASQSPATLGEPSLVSRMVAKPLPVVSSLEEISNKQANGETGDITEGKATQHRSKHKRQQKKELNRKGAEKEGTEMDAFAEASSPASTATSENTVPSRSPAVASSSTPVSAALPPQFHSPTPSNSIAASIPIPEPSYSTLVSSVVSQVTAQSTTVSALSPPAISSPESVSNPSSDPVSQLSASTNSMLVDNTKSDNGEEKTHHDHKNEIQLEKEDQEKIVVARNEENTKMSPINTEKQPLIEHSASLKSNHLAKSKEDQWSPNNLDGKKKYEREFLMSLKNEPLSKKKPNLLPEHEIVLKEPRPSRSLDIARGCHDTFTPKFMSTLGPSRGGVPPKRSSQQGKAKSGKSGVIHVTLSLREEVKLRETENAWKPVRLKPNEAQELDAKTEELYKKVRGVLNKLTPQKFTTLVDQVRNLPIDTLEKLQGVINLIFDKAIDEPSFSVAYALMCKVLSDMNVSSNKDQKKPKEDEMSFRKLIIIRCQQEFEKSNVAELNKEQRLKEIASIKDPEKKREMQLLFEEECRKLRMKSVGNIRFIGELFKLQILTAKIMQRCILQLLNDGEEESLECLCKLLSTIGHEFEMVKQESLEPCFNKMKDICKKKGEISSRVRFMLQDVIELRQNKWVPRRDDLKPKTIDQINKEAEKEAAEQAMNSGPSSGPRFKNDDRGGDKKKSRGPSEDGWSEIGRAKKYPVDTAKLRTKVLESDTISLGNRNTYVWCSHSKAADPSKKNASKVISYNSFAALQDMSNEEKHVSGFSSRSAVSKIAPSSSVEKERMLAGLKSVTEDTRPQRSHIQQSRSSSRDNAPCNSDELHINASQRPMLSSGNDESFRGKSPDASSLPSVVPLISDEEAKIRAVGLLGEFLNNFSERLAMQEIVAVFGGMKLNILVWEFLNGVLEKSSTARKKVGQFFCTLMAEGMVPKNIFLSSFSTLIDDGDDLSIDVPLIWLYLAEIIVPSLSSERITFSEIRVVAKNQGKLVAELLKLLVEDKGPAWVKSHWDSAGCTWTDFVPAENVKDFVKQRNLDFTLSAGLVSQTSGSLLRMDEVQKKLVQFFKPEPGFAYSFDDICDWISANVGDRVSDPQFVRALMTALCESATSRSGTSTKLKDEVLIQHCKFFQKYVYNKEEYEMQCLYAIQAFVNELEHPQGLICKIFQTLWENNFISNESFLMWENCKEPSEQAGKGVAVVSLTSFFTCLKEGEDESEES